MPDPTPFGSFRIAWFLGQSGAWTIGGRFNLRSSFTLGDTTRRDPADVRSGESGQARQRID